MCPFSLTLLHIHSLKGDCRGKAYVSLTDRNDSPVPSIQETPKAPKALAIYSARLFRTTSPDHEATAEGEVMAFRKIESSLWYDDKVRSLTTDAKLLWVYLLTNPHSSALGIYVISRATIADDLDWPLAKTDRTFSEIVAKSLVRYDDTARVLLIPNYLKHNGSFENAGSRIAAVRQLSLLPKSALLQDFLALAKVSLKLSEELAKSSLTTSDTGSYSDTSTNTSTGTNTQDPPLPPNGGEYALMSFEEFWDLYPRKKSKGQAEKAWKALKPNVELQERISQAIFDASRSHAWLKEGGKYIPYPASWLRAKGWEDEADQ